MKKCIREVRVSDIVYYFGLSPVFIAIIWVAYGLLAKFNVLPFNILYTLPLFILITCRFTKNFIIGMVLLYKAYAPLEVRAKCRFEPTCSTYMIMALKKYGLIIGLIKGIGRLIRCKPPNGGEDYP